MRQQAEGRRSSGVGAFECVVAALVAVDVGLYIFIRKNEAILGGIVRQAVFFVHFQEVGGIVQLMALAAAALVLDFTELVESAFELAGEALAVDTDLGEGAGVLAERQGHCEGSFGLRMIRPDAGFHFGAAEREEIGLDRGSAVDSPGGIDERLDELGFGGTFGLVFVEEGFRVTLIGGVILGRQDDGLAR